MQRMKSVLLAGLVLAPAAQAQTTVFATDSAGPWIGFMNVFELPANGGGFVFGSGWGIPDLVAGFDDGAANGFMATNNVNDPDPFWYVAGPNSMGNKDMEANLFQESTGVFNGDTVTFEGEILSNTFTSAHVGQIFIRDFAPDFSSSVDLFVPATPGPFSISLATINDPGRHIQWGFQVKGINVWPGDEGPFGNMVFATGEPASNFEEGCYGDGAGTACPCGNNDAANPATGGCLNGNGTGAVLSTNGDASAGSNSLQFSVTGASLNTFAVLVSGDNALGGGNGIIGLPVKDGLRCVGGNSLRHGTRGLDGTGANPDPFGSFTGPAGGIIGGAGFAAGQTRHFQVRYREDPMTGPCGSDQNTSQRISVTFKP